MKPRLFHSSTMFFEKIDARNQRTAAAAIQTSWRPVVDIVELNVVRRIGRTAATESTQTKSSAISVVHFSSATRRQEKFAIGRLSSRREGKWQIRARCLTLKRLTLKMASAL